MSDGASFSTILIEGRGARGTSARIARCGCGCVVNFRPLALTGLLKTSFKNSLLSEKNSLIWFCKFPVPLRREFAYKRLNSAVDQISKAERRARFGKIP